MTSAFLLPYIGKNYASSDLKILLVGERHYLKGAADWRPDFTQWVIGKVIESHKGKFGTKGSQAFSKLFRSIAGKQSREVSQEEWIKFWDSVAYYSYLQFPEQVNPKHQVEQKHFLEAYEPFLQVWKELQPDLVVIYSRRAYHALMLSLKEKGNPTFPGREEASGSNSDPAGEITQWWSQIEAPVPSLLVASPDPGSPAFDEKAIREIAAAAGLEMPSPEGLAPHLVPLPKTGQFGKGWKGPEDRRSPRLNRHSAHPEKS